MLARSDEFMDAPTLCLWVELLDARVDLIGSVLRDETVCSKINQTDKKSGATSDRGKG